MPFKKAALTKKLDLDGAEPVEVIDMRLQYEIFPGESYEAIRAAFLQRCDRRFTEMFAAELGLMPERAQEGERWRQMGLFDEDPAMAAARALHQMGVTIAASRDRDQ